MDERLDFIRFALDAGVLRFGEFRTKAGRLSPYFFNAGLFDDGAKLGGLAGFYARRLQRAEREEGLRFDMLYGPAYKGITLASATAVALAASGNNVPFAFNRKEAKDHGEGGTLVGSPLRGRVVIVDDVISAGTSVRESVEMIRGAGAEPVAVLIALDRMERGGTAEAPTGSSAVQEVRHDLGLQVISIATLGDVFAFLGDDARLADAAVHRGRIADYRARYGVSDA